VCRLTSLAFLAIALSLCGCKQSVDLAAIRALAQATADSQVSFSTLTNDYYQSCVRRVGWIRGATLPAVPQPSRSSRQNPAPLRGPLTITVTPGDVNNTLKQAMEVLNTLPGYGAGGSMPDVTKPCEEDRKAALQWQAANNIVTNYIAALGALAGGSDPGDYGIPKLLETFTKIDSKAFTATQKTAFGNAAASLVNDYFKIRQRNAIAESAAKADCDLQELIGVLATKSDGNVAANYISDLYAERTSVYFFFATNVGQAKPGIERLLALKYTEDEHAEMATIDKHQAAAEAYRTALQKIATTHAALVNSIKSNHVSDMSAIVKQYLAEYRPEIKALDAAFK